MIYFWFTFIILEVDIHFQQSFLALCHPLSSSLFKQVPMVIVHLRVTAHIVSESPLFRIHCSIVLIIPVLHHTSVISLLLLSVVFTLLHSFTNLPRMKCLHPISSWFFHTLLAWVGIFSIFTPCPIIILAIVLIIWSGAHLAFSLCLISSRTTWYPLLSFTVLQLRKCSLLYFSPHMRHISLGDCPVYFICNLVGWCPHTILVNAGIRSLPSKYRHINIRHVEY